MSSRVRSAQRAQNVDLMQTGKIACIVTDEGPDHLHEKETMLLARLYVLGEKYQDVHFKYSAIDAMVAKHHDPEEKGGSGWSPSGPDVDVIYRGTCADSPVRKLMVDMHMQAGWGNWIRENGIHNLEFMKDLCAAMLDSRHEERVAGNLEYKGIGQSVSYHEEVEGK